MYDLTLGERKVGIASLAGFSFWYKYEWLAFIFSERARKFVGCVDLVHVGKFLSLGKRI